jgi:hypothetical protein
MTKAIFGEICKLKTIHPLVLLLLLVLVVVVVVVNRAAIRLIVHPVF